MRDDVMDVFLFWLYASKHASICPIVNSLVEYIILRGSYEARVPLEGPLGQHIPGSTDQRMSSASTT